MRVARTRRATPTDAAADRTDATRGGVDAIERDRIDADAVGYEPGPDAGPARRAAGPRTVSLSAFLAVALAAIAFAVVAVVATVSRSADDGAAADEVRTAAGQFAERFLSFTHTDIDGWKAEVLATSTGGFADELGRVESSLRELIGESSMQATARVTDLFVGDVVNGSVSVVVLYDRTVTTDDNRREETNRYLQLNLASVEGRWLVEDIIDISTVGDTREQSLDPATVTSTAPTAESPPSTVDPGGN